MRPTVLSVFCFVLERVVPGWRRQRLFAMLAYRDVHADPLQKR